MSEEEKTIIAPALSDGGGDPEEEIRTPVLVAFAGQLLGQSWELGVGEISIGRSTNCTIQVTEGGVSREHARLACEDDKVFVEDLKSTNGTLVNELAVERAELHDGDFVKVGASVFKFTVRSSLEASFHEELYKLSTVDNLTGAYNKRHFLAVLERELSRAERYRRFLTLALFDIDFFKKVNDNFGHLAGDEVLRELSRLVKGSVRKNDTFARYGGEEFALVLPEIGKEDSFDVCEKLRKKVEGHSFSHEGKDIPVTISIGYCTLLPGTSGVKPNAIIEAADSKLYDAKKSGRNKVCC